MKKILLLGLGTSLLALRGSAAPLAWKEDAHGRQAALSVSSQPVGRSGFTLLPEAETGIAFTNHLSDVLAAENQIRLIGSGVALGDIDGDGRCDLYLCRLDGSNALYRNLGDWKFVDIAAAAGVDCPGQFSTGAVLADIDGDGDLDLLVNGIGKGTRCFVNDGHGHFQETSGGGLLKKYTATSMALADIDGDGDLDLYVANYRTTTIRSTGLDVLNIGGKRVVRPQDREDYQFTPEGLLLEQGEPDQLYLNDGQGHFTPVPWTGGNFLDEDGQPLARAPRDWGLSVMLRDVNGDGAPDIYVCNDFWSPDRFWLNDGHGHFRAVPRLAQRNNSTFSMGVDFADINRDGHDDFIVLDMLSRDHARRMRQRAMAGQNFNNLGRIDDRPQVERNTLFVNRGDHTWAEIAQVSGLQASEWSWGVVFLDVDLDGFEDLLITSGHAFDTQDSDTDARINALGPSQRGKLSERLLRYPRLPVAHAAFRNRGDLTFEECAARWGFDAVGVAHGMALADLDGDGDLDVVVNNLNGAVGIYRNEATAPRVAVRLQGLAPNTRGVGARLRLLGGPVPQSQQMIAGGRYLSGDEVMRVFAAGTSAGPLTLEVTWRSGHQTVLPQVEPNHVYEVAETGGTTGPPPAPAQPSPAFRDVSPLLGHIHHDEPFNDFERQPLLSRRLSQLGPGICWCDWDGDGWEDLIIGSGRGGATAFYRNRGDGRFEVAKLGNALSNARDDQTTLLAWRTPTGPCQLICGTANYETGEPSAPSVLTFELNASGLIPQQTIPEADGSTGPLALGDVEGKGDMALFVGGRVLRGRYPEPVMSQLFRRSGGRWVPAQQWLDLGLVTSALFTDLDGDGRPELVVTCEWGPIKIFKYKDPRHQFEPWDWKIALPAAVTNGAEIRTLNDLTGWWNGVASGDFDGDGRMDLAAANWGRNTPHTASPAEPWRLFYGDFGGRGRVDTVEGGTDPLSHRVVPWRDLEAMTAVAPWLRDKFPTAESYGRASLDDVLGDRRSALKELSVRWLDSTLFLNRGDHFEVKSLPAEAQWAPAFSVCVGDYDADGREDVYLSQNFFAVEEQTSRSDAGRGLWLQGDGKGGLDPVPGQQSGVRVYGEQRGAALADYDRDGRVDLVVTQNAAETKLFHNETPNAGWRVRFQGPAGNPLGAGVQVRLTDGHHSGPTREIHLGSGYWSQDGATQVLGFDAAPSHLLVRWPGKREVRLVLPTAARDVTVDENGLLPVTRGK